MGIGFILVMSTILVGIDQLLKSWVLTILPGNPSILIIPHLLQLTYVENRGAAFGILQGRVGILSLLTLAVMIILIVLLIRGSFPQKMLRLSFGLIIAGGVGNLIDRIFRGFVVDYLDISPLFSFPVFNFADCCVVIGTGLFLFYLLVLEEREKKQQEKATAAQLPDEEEQIG